MAGLRKKNLIEDERKVVSLNPKKLVSHFYDKVDVLTAGIVIFIAIFLELVIFLFLKMPRVLEYFTIRLITNFVFSWLILGVLLYLLLYFVKGKKNLKTNEFKKILSGLASFRIVSILSILIVCAILLIFMPGVFSTISLIFNNPAFYLESGILPSLGILGIIGLILLFVFTFALFVYYIIMLYHFVKKMYNFKSFLPNFIMMIIVLIIMGLISSII